MLAQVENKEAESILGESSLAGPLKKRLAERILAAELAPMCLVSKEGLERQSPQRHQPKDHDDQSALPQPVA